MNKLKKFIILILILILILQMIKLRENYGIVITNNSLTNQNNYIY